MKIYELAFQILVSLEIIISSSSLSFLILYLKEIVFNKIFISLDTSLHISTLLKA